MSDEVFWIVELAIKPGQHQALTALMDEMIAATETNEPGTLGYLWFVDGDRCHIYERYADSAAVLEHMNNFGTKFAKRFLAALEPERFTVYGSPSDEAKKVLAGMGAVFMAQAAGFQR